MPLNVQGDEGDNEQLDKLDLSPVAGSCVRPCDRNSDLGWGGVGCE